MKGIIDRIGFIVVLIGYFFLMQRIGPMVYYETLYLIDGKEINAKVINIIQDKSEFIIEFENSNTNNDVIYQTNKLQKNNYYIGEISQIRITKYSNIAIQWKRVFGLYIALFIIIILMTIVAAIYGWRIFMPEKKLKLYRKLGSSPKNPILD